MGAAVRKLDDAECWARLAVATVGRLGLCHDDEVEILPVSYRLSGRRLLLLTQPDSRLHRLGQQRRRLAFEVDYADPLFTVAWSVLLQGELREAGDGASDDHELRRHVISWLGP